MEAAVTPSSVWINRLSQTKLLCTTNDDKINQSYSMYLQPLRLRLRLRLHPQQAEGNGTGMPVEETPSGTAVLAESIIALTTLTPAPHAHAKHGVQSCSILPRDRRVYKRSWQWHTCTVLQNLRSKTIPSKASGTACISLRMKVPIRGAIRHW